MTVDRPTSRNAMTGAMYFGVRCAVDWVNSDDSLAGLVITGTGDVFIPGGDLGPDAMDRRLGLAARSGAWTSPRSSRSATPAKPVERGQRVVSGRRLADCDDVGRGGRLDRSTFRARTAAGHRQTRAELAGMRDEVQALLGPARDVRKNAEPEPAVPP